MGCSIGAPHENSKAPGPPRGWFDAEIDGTARIRGSRRTDKGGSGEQKPFHPPAVLGLASDRRGRRRRGRPAFHRAGIGAQGFSLRLPPPIFFLAFREKRRPFQPK